MVGAHLARIFDRERRFASGEKKQRQRTAGLGAERAHGRDAAGGQPSAVLEHGLSRRVELPIALFTIGLPVDLRQIVPNSHQMRIAACRRELEDFAVGRIGRPHQRRRPAVAVDAARRRAVRKFRLVDHQRAEQQGSCAAVLHVSADAVVSAARIAVPPVTRHTSHIASLPPAPASCSPRWRAAGLYFRRPSNPTTPST